MEFSEAVSNYVHDIMDVERPFMFMPADMSIRGFCETMAKGEYTETYKNEAGRMRSRSFPYHGEVVIIYKDKLYHVPFADGEVKDCNIPNDSDMWGASIRTVFPLGSAKSAERTYYLLTK